MKRLWKESYVETFTVTSRIRPVGEWLEYVRPVLLLIVVGDLLATGRFAYHLLGDREASSDSCNR